MGQKIVIIGAGSMAFTTTIVSTIFADPFYKGSTVGLVDIDAENLEIMRKYLERANSELGCEITFEASTNRRDVLPGADIVTISGRVMLLPAIVRQRYSPPFGEKNCKLWYSAREFL